MERPGAGDPRCVVCGAEPFGDNVRVIKAHKVGDGFRALGMWHTRECPGSLPEIRGEFDDAD